VSIFIDRGAPLRNTLSALDAADFPMLAIRTLRVLGFGELG
jgi:hypothetical protein